MAKSDHIFADQLNVLFANSRQRTTNTMVATALTARGCSISAAYLSQLRNGVRTRPADRYVRAIAEYFEAPLSHFYDDPFEGTSAETFDCDLSLIDDVDDQSIRRLLRIAHGLSPSSMDLLLDFEGHLLNLRSHLKAAQP